MFVKITGNEIKISKCFAKQKRSRSKISLWFIVHHNIYVNITRNVISSIILSLWDSTIKLMDIAINIFSSFSIHPNTTTSCICTLEVEIKLRLIVKRLIIELIIHTRLVKKILVLQR